MRDLYKDYKNKKFDEKKLIEYGFNKATNKFVYRETIVDDQFEIVVEISKSKAISKLVDLFSEDEYAMVDVKDSVGEFVGKVREEYELCLNDIISNCTIPNVFKESQTQRVIKYIKEKYGISEEYPWDESEGAAIWRNQDNQKWFGIIMTVKESSIIKSTEDAIKKYLNNKAPKNFKPNKNNTSDEKLLEVIDLRYIKDKTLEVADYKTIFPAYHMNKKSWITIVLDDSMDDSIVFSFIDKSYDLVKPSTTGSFMIPANNDIFDIIGYFEEYDTITWHKSSKMKEGDFVYIYMGAPYSAIMFKLYVSRINVGRSGKKTATMTLLEKYSKDKYPLSFLKENGVNSVHFPRSLPKNVVEKMN